MSGTGGVAPLSEKPRSKREIMDTGTVKGVLGQSKRFQRFQDIQKGCRTFKEGFRTFKEVFQDIQKRGKVLPTHLVSISSLHNLKTVT